MDTLFGHPSITANDIRMLQGELQKLEQSLFKRVKQILYYKDNISYEDNATFNQWERNKELLRTET